MASAPNVGVKWDPIAEVDARERVLRLRCARACRLQHHRPVRRLKRTSAWGVVAVGPRVHGVPACMVINAACNATVRRTSRLLAQEGCRSKSTTCRLASMDIAAR